MRVWLIPQVQVGHFKVGFQRLDKYSGTFGTDMIFAVL